LIRNSGKWSKLDFSRNFASDDQRIPDPPEEAILEVLKIIGKDNPDKEINCGACGYLSCREFASTVAKGLAIPEMCHTYNLRNKQEYIETLRMTNRKLADTKKALKDSEELARREKEIAQSASDMMNILKYFTRTRALLILSERMQKLFLMLYQDLQVQILKL
jgi:CO dehydrogenase/acetyl-CoA synthase gamma subunit (corrinoid Fe-S protein)